MDFLIQKNCDRIAELNINYCYKNHCSFTSKGLQLELYDKRTQTHFYVISRFF